MIQLYYYIVHGCAHKWKTIDRVHVNGGIDGTWTRTYCECTKCGRPQRFG